jgi:DNA helicase MCM8
MSEIGRIPRTIECDVTDDLVDLVVPGDVVHVSGIVKVSSEDDGKIVNAKSSLHILYVHANSISTSKLKTKVPAGIIINSSSTKESVKKQIESIFLSETDRKVIRAIASKPNVFKLLVHSLCPTIFGHEYVKGIV